MRDASPDALLDEGDGVFAELRNGFVGVNVDGSSLDSSEDEDDADGDGALTFLYVDFAGVNVGG